MPPPYGGSQPYAKCHRDHSCDDSPGIDIVISRLSEEPHATITQAHFKSAACAPSDSATGDVAKYLIGLNQCVVEHTKERIKDEDRYGYGSGELECAAIISHAANNIRIEAAPFSL